MHDFWRHEIDGSTACFGGLFYDFSKAKVTYFTSIASIFIFLEEDVLTLKISMDYITIMNHLSTFHNLIEYVESLRK